jgi:hypothetical protein
MVALSLLCGMLIAGGVLPSGQEPPRPSPITVQVGETATRQGGFLEFLKVLATLDVAPAEDELESTIERKPWLRVTGGEAEVAVAITNARRSESSRSKSKDGKKVTVTYRYEVSGSIAVPGDRESFDAEVTESHTYTVGSGRQDPESYQNRMAYERAGRAFGQRACAWILARIDMIRPGALDVGFRHKVRTKRLGLVGDGLEILEVVPGSPAAQGGLVVGDRVRHVGAEGGTTEMDEIVRTWPLLAAGMPVSLEVERQKERRTIVFTLPAQGAVPEKR